ncbi:MAG TPA: helix-turn-helix transcriptional regulator [Thermoanaerobaculia bacterium]|nr:helix-turn-helix transcriptional regulator [Thermoanaerobaculia bacterium]
MIGEKIRAARNSRKLSLAQVARKAKLSTASLSRIETNKQDVNTELLLLLCRLLDVGVVEIIGQEEPAQVSLAASVASLSTARRARFWRDLAVLDARGDGRAHHLEQELAELLALCDLLRGQLNNLYRPLPRRGAQDAEKLLR